MFACLTNSKECLFFRNAFISLHPHTITISFIAATGSLYDDDLPLPKPKRTGQVNFMVDTTEPDIESVASHPSEHSVAEQNFARCMSIPNADIVEYPDQEDQECE